MSYVIAAPEMMTSAASDLATIGSDVSAAHLAAAAPTVGLVPAAADEVSAAVTHLFSQHAAGYQATAAQAAAFHDEFVQHLTAGAGSYAHAEAANTALLHPAQAPTDIPLINFIIDGLLSLITAIVELPGQLYNAFIAMPPVQALLFLLALPIEILKFLLIDTVPPISLLPL